MSAPDGRLVRHGQGREVVHRRHSSRDHQPETSGNRGAQRQSQEVPPRSYVPDRKGDRQNLTYGSPNRHAIPRYHTAGRGNVIGIGRRYRLVALADGARELVDRGLDSESRPRKESLMANIDEEDLQPLRLHLETDVDFESQEDFIAVADRRSRKRRRLSRNEGDNDTDSHDSDSDSSDTAGKGTETANQPDAYDALKQDPIHQRQVHLSRMTIEQPENLQAWLDLIDFQETRLRDGGTSKHGIGSKSSRSLIDMKISLFEQALSRITDRTGREHLVLGMMREGSKIWDSQKQADRWRSFLNGDSSHALWLLHLNFVQSNVVHFSVDQCLDSFDANLKRIQRGVAGVDRDIQSVYIILRMTTFLWQAGFTERAIAVWQAMIEFNCFRPSKLTHEAALPLFEDFWAREVARVGEEGAAGWSTQRSAPVEPRVDAKPDTPDTTSLDGWADVEETLAVRNQMPARMLDDVNDDDPYRVTLFSDLENFLTTCTTNEGLEGLLDAFMIFCNLPPISYQEQPRHWQHDPFVVKQEILHSIKRSDVGESSFEPEQQNLFPDLSSLSFRTDMWPYPIDSSATSSGAGLTSIARRALAQLSANKGQNLRLLQYSLALECSIDVKAARKMAKALLKTNPSELPLYNAYAIIEFRLGNVESANRVWSTALNMRRSLGKSSEDVSFLLWRDWAWVYMCDKRFTAARGLLSQVANTEVDENKNTTETISASEQLKAQQYVRTRLDVATSAGELEYTLVLTDVLALQTYLSRDFQLRSAIEVYDETIKHIRGLRVSATTQVARELHRHRAHFLHSHASIFNLAYKPREIADLLTRSTQTFPDDLYLLRLHQLYLQKSGILNRLHAQLEPSQKQLDAEKVDATLVTYIYEVVEELGRPHYSGSTQHSIRAAFQRATHIESPGHNCVALWRPYVSWEAAQISREPVGAHSKRSARDRKDQSVNVAVEAFYASLRACPWAKELYLLGFQDERLRRGIGQVKLKEAYQSLLDRGLRVRFDISDSI